MEQSLRKKTNRVNLLLILVVCSLECFCHAATELPDESQRLLNNLKSYEKQEQKKLDAQITRKRNEVLVLLRKHLKQRTRIGQLDKALAIRKEIEKLEALTTGRLPGRISVAEVTYLGSGAKAPAIAESYIIDTDSDGGKLTLHFKHEELNKFLNTFKKVHLEMTIAKVEYADSTDIAILRYQNKTLAVKKGVKLGEIVKLSFDPWKIVRIRDTLSLTLENSGTDGYVVLGGNGKSSPALVFEN